MREFNFKLLLFGTLVILLCQNVLRSSQCKPRRRRNSHDTKNCRNRRVCCFRLWIFGRICKKSCVGYCCDKDGDCRSQEYCTLSRRCANRVRSTYPPPTLRLVTTVNSRTIFHTGTPTRAAAVDKCTQDSECTAGKYCCIVDWTGPIEKECKSSCVSDLCYENTDCGLNEYCKGYRCDLVTKPTAEIGTPTRAVDKCTQDSECATGKYCCIVDWTGPIEKECKSSCVSDLCYENTDCGLNEYCKNLRCELDTKRTVQIGTPTRAVDKCAKDSECATGKYCCIVDWTGPIEKECKSSCVGDNCYEDSDCAVNESCNSNGKCVA